MKRHRLGRLSTGPVSLWLASAASMAVALIVAPLVRRIDDLTRWTLMGFAADGARQILAALASSLLTFIVFAISILFLAAQMASGQFSPRIIARVFEDRLTKLTLGCFVFTWVYALSALGRVEDRVPQLPVAVAVLLSLVSVGLFLYRVQSAVKILRPVNILTDIARDTRIVIETVYPNEFSAGGGGPVEPIPDPGPARAVIAYRGRSGVVLSFDAAGLAALAGRAGCVVKMVPMVGDFLATGDDLFRLYGAGAESLVSGDLRRCVTLGPERTLKRDPAFGFRIIVDIASKALSPAINDPTTAVLAIDQLHNLLRVLGGRQLDPGVVRDRSGRALLVYRTPNWEDFVTLAATEIRLYGATSPQVGRRLQAMFEHLLRTVPAPRAEAIKREMALLARTTERSYADPEDRVMALHGDLQGFGSRTEPPGA